MTVYHVHFTCAPDYMARRLPFRPAHLTPCFQRAAGELMTGRQRLELLARHWDEHLRELREAAKGVPHA